MVKCSSKARSHARNITKEWIWFGTVYTTINSEIDKIDITVSTFVYSLNDTQRDAYHKSYKRILCLNPMNDKWKDAFQWSTQCSAKCVLFYFSHLTGLHTHLSSARPIKQFWIFIVSKLLAVMQLLEIIRKYSNTYKACWRKYLDATRLKQMSHLMQGFPARTQKAFFPVRTPILQIVWR
jgi:hypothetical protein